jgi:hypothetical protein
MNKHVCPICDEGSPPLIIEVLKDGKWVRVWTNGSRR